MEERVEDMAGVSGRGEEVCRKACEERKEGDTSLNTAIDLLARVIIFFSPFPVLL